MENSHIRLDKKSFIKITFMLFSLFFGAGNLIFPPMVGKLSGENVFIVMFFFSITSIVLPMLAVVSVSKTLGLKILADRVDEKFSYLITILIYLSIGPGLAIPRAGSLPFEITISPYLPKSINLHIALLIFSIVFFGVAYYLSSNPTKLLDRMGKILTPSLLIMIGMLFIGIFFKPMGQILSPVGEYAKSPATKGFLDGYMTLDAIAGLNFGVVIALSIKSLGIENSKDIQRITVKAGFGAGLILAIIYSMLAYLGVRSAEVFPLTENGASILTSLTNYFYGSFGALLLGGIFLLACLNVSVGLLTSSSQYFSSLSNRISYKTWLRVLVIISFILSNAGLNMILKFTLPALLVIYPVSIMLILLGLVHEKLKLGKYTYKIVCYITLIVSILSSLKIIGINIECIEIIFGYLPMNDVSLGWVFPAMISFAIGFVLDRKFYKN